MIEEARERAREKETERECGRECGGREMTAPSHRVNTNEQLIPRAERVSLLRGSFVLSLQRLAPSLGCNVR